MFIRIILYECLSPWRRGEGGPGHGAPHRLHGGGGGPGARGGSAPARPCRGGQGGQEGPGGGRGQAKVPTGWAKVVEGRLEDSLVRFFLRFNIIFFCIHIKTVVHHPCYSKCFWPAFHRRRQCCVGCDDASALTMNDWPKFW